jgi:hypothetical protein
MKNNALLVRAQSPIAGEEPRLLVASLEAIKELARCGRTHKIGQYMGLVRADEVTYEHSADTIQGLLYPTAIFRGVERPWTNGTRGEKILAYVTTPPYSFSFDNRFGDTAKIEKKPENSVFVTLVEYSSVTVSKFSGSLGNISRKIDGAILEWEWVLADQGHPGLPENYNTRYTSRVR